MLAAREEAESAAQARLAVGVIAVILVNAMTAAVGPAS